MKPSLRLGIILVVGVLAMSSASVLIRLSRAEGAPVPIIAAYRLSAATLALTVPAAQQRVWREYRRLAGWELGVLTLSGLLLGLHFATWITSLNHTSVMSSVVLVTTTPLWIGLAAPLLLGEKTPRSTWLGIVVAMAGGILIGLADWSEAQQDLAAWGDVLALLGAIFGAGYLLIGRHIRARLSFAAYVWFVYGVAALVLTGWALMSGLRLTGYTPTAVVYMIALGLVPQLIGHSSANYALRDLPASMVGVVVLGEPVGSTLLAILLLREWPVQLQVVGGLVVLAGIAVATLARQSAAPIQGSLEPSEP